MFSYSTHATPLQVLPVIVQGSLIAVPSSAVKAVYRDAGGSESVLPDAASVYTPLPVIDLRALLFSPERTSMESHVVVVSIEGRNMGLRVDGVMPIRQIPPAARRHLPELANREPHLFESVIIGQGPLMLELRPEGALELLVRSVQQQQKEVADVY